MHLELLLYLAQATVCEWHNELHDAQMLECLQHNGTLYTLHGAGYLGELVEASKDDLEIKWISVVDG